MKTNARLELKTMRPRKKASLAAATCAMLVIAWFVAPYHPAYQEWRCKDSSLEKLLTLQTQMPENPTLFYYLGLRFQEARRHAEAAAAFERAVALDLDSPRLRNALAQMHMASGQNREAYKVVRQFYETHHDNPEAFLMMARFYLTTQTFAPAATLLKEATGKFPDNAECWAMLAISQQRISDMLEAEKSAAIAVRLRPQESKYWYLQAQILKQSRNSLARNSYEKALKLSPNEVGVQADFADYLARAAEYKTAEELARKVLQIQPEDLRASGALGIALADRNDPAATLLLLKGLQNNSKDILILRTLHRMSVKTGSSAEADRWLKQTVLVQNELLEESELNTKLELNPEDAKALRQMASLMGRNGDYFRCTQYQARASKQVADAPAVLLSAAENMASGGFPQIARRLRSSRSKTAKLLRNAISLRSFFAALPDIKAPGADDPAQKPLNSAGSVVM